MVELSWKKCKGEVWCNFYTLNLEHPNFGDPTGIYIIWSNKDVVYVGGGRIKNEILQRRQETRFRKYNNLKVVWARLESQQINGVMKYYIDKLNPKEIDEDPKAIPIEANWPWD